jgi:hypothetical protein
VQYSIFVYSTYYQLCILMFLYNIFCAWFSLTMATSRRVYTTKQRTICFLTLSLFRWNFKNTHNINLQRLKNIVSPDCIRLRATGRENKRSVVQQSLLVFLYRRQVNVLPFSYIYNSFISKHLLLQVVKMLFSQVDSLRRFQLLVLDYKMPSVWYQSGQMLFLIATIFQLLLLLRVLDKTVNFKWSSLSPTD